MKAVAAVVALVGFTSNLHGAEPAFLSAAELRGLIVGNTVEISTTGSTTARVYFDPDGQRLALQPEGEYALPWRILPDGLQCVTTGTGDDCARVVGNVDGSYSRMRDGQIVTRWLRILPGKSLGSLAQGVYVRQLAADKYLLQLVGPASLTEIQSHARVAETASAVCKTMNPVLGVYRYETTQRVDATVASEGSNSLRFMQELACEAKARPSPVERRPTLQSAEESRDVQQQIRTRSETYLKLLADGLLDDAYDQVDGEGMGVDAATWKSQKRSFQALAGRAVHLSVVKITVYDNPPAAARPGLYVAADYVNEYQNMPLHCGYLMWFREANGQFRIAREEVGYMTAEELKKLPPAQLATTRRQLRCVTPAE